MLRPLYQYGISDLTVYLGTYALILSHSHSLLKKKRFNTNPNHMQLGAATFAGWIYHALK